MRSRRNPSGRFVTGRTERGLRKTGLCRKAEGSRNGIAAIQRMMQITEIDDPRLVKGLAHPLRIQILRVLENRVASPSEIADEIGAPLGNVSYHVRFLARVGLIELTSTKPRRGAVEHYYRSVGRVHVTDNAWSQVPDVVKNGLIGATLDQAGRAVGAAASNGGFDRQNASVVRRQLMLDERGFADLSKELRALLERAKQIEQDSADRIAAGSDGTEGTEGTDGRDGSDGHTEAGLVMMLFESAGDEPAAPVDGDGRRPAKR
jgi:DNA-binding transcriptional ArsR family regulator